MEHPDTIKNLAVGRQTYTFCDIHSLDRKPGLSINRLPFSTHILSENLTRRLDNINVQTQDRKAFTKKQSKLTKSIYKGFRHDN